MSEIVERVYEFIRKGGVSYVELEREFGAGDGEYLTCSSIDHNIIFWCSINPDVEDALVNLQHSGRVEANPTDALVYVVDGGVIDMPIARRPPKKGYKTQHWLPITFSHTKVV